MKPIVPLAVQEAIDSFQQKDVYIHLETTNGAYASHFGGGSYSAGAYIRNALVQYEHGKIKGDGPYRVGLKIALGWVYAEGVTHFMMDDQNRLLLAGLDESGRLAVSLQISETPFE
ncbi:YojF family protein [Bacillus massiliigorillae]|uniref:YojF family protein n=1 Tax=Bacillus massiliigorillae TaxID=1243664 RepID=UPI0003A0B6E7|nr:YojF family protein [Bacillus massiliigorillae]